MCCAHIGCELFHQRACNTVPGGGNVPQSSPPWPSLRGAIPHYVAAVLAVAAAVVAGLLVDRFLQSAPFVSLFLCAILLAAWLGGLGPGLLAIGLSHSGF